MNHQPHTQSTIHLIAIEIHTQAASANAAREELKQQVELQRGELTALAISRCAMRLFLEPVCWVLLGQIYWQWSCKGKSLLALQTAGAQCITRLNPCACCA
jgi:hypothetical protein